MSNAGSIMAREEPLIKQLIRSRAPHPRDASLSPIRRSVAPRSSSQPASIQRHRLPPQPSAPSFTLQFVPLSSLVSATNLNTMVPMQYLSVSMSQPDLTASLQTPPSYSPTTSRCSSPLPPSTSRCASPAPATLSPLSLSRASTRPATPTLGFQAMADMGNRVYTAPTDIFHDVNSNEVFNRPNSMNDVIDAETAWIKYSQDCQKPMDVSPEDDIEPPRFYISTPPQSMASMHDENLECDFNENHIEARQGQIQCGSPNCQMCDLLRRRASGEIDNPPLPVNPQRLTAMCQCEACVYALAQRMPPMPVQNDNARKKGPSLLLQNGNNTR